MKIEQILHGYKDGHELLASSISLSAKDARYMRIQSDISGNLSLEDCYVKGYPLLEEKFYVIATTWYAPEMKRPGCVWTHSLLIPFESLFKIHNFKYIIRNLFLRPDTDKVFSSYNKSLDIEDNLLVNMNPEIQFLSSIINQTLYNIFFSYFATDKPIIAQYSKDSDFEEYILSLWNTLPYNQKNSFSFTIGTTELTKLNGDVNPDIQILKSSNNRQLIKSSIFKVIPNLNNKEVSINEDILFLSRLSEKIPASYSAFLQNFSKDVSGGKQQSLSICKFYKLLTDKNIKISETEIIKLLGESFTSPTEARKLKFSLIGNNNLNLFDEGRLLFGLLTSPYLKSFNLTDLNYEQRLVRFILDNSIDSLRYFSHVIMQSEIIPNTELHKYLLLLSKYLTPDLLQIMNSKYRELLSVCVMMNPDIVSMSEYWQTNKQLLYENFKNLITIKDLNINWQEMLNLFLNENIPIDHSLIVDYVPNAAVNILNWVNENEKKLPDNYYLVLKKSRKQIIKWIKDNEQISSRLFFLIIDLINPNDSLTLEISPIHWMKIIKKNDIDFSGRSHLEEKANFFLVAIAFNFPIKESIILLEISFNYVYTTIMKAELYTPNWELLDKHTPDLRYHNWDKGERLRMTIAEKLISANMEAKEIKRFVYGKKDREDFQKRYNNSKKSGFFFFFFSD